MSTKSPSSPKPESDNTLPRGRRWAVRGLIATATLLTIISIFAVWANRQLLDANNWADTSTQLLENDDIRGQVAAVLVDQVYAQTDVPGELASALPPRLKPLAGSAANGLRQLAEARANRLLERPRVQELWSAANKVTAEQFIAIAEGKSRAVSVNGDAVVLNARVLVKDLVIRLGGSGKLVNKVPPSAGVITIMPADKVTLLQNAVGALQGLSAVLPALAIALFALAVYLARGRRRKTLMYAGVGLIVAGIVVLVIRNLGGNYLVSQLSKSASTEPTINAVWSIATGMLTDVAQASIIMGIPVVIAAWVAGPTRAAVAVRREAAPWLRTRPDIAFGAVAVALLLIVAWGPIHATRMPLPVLLMTVLAFAGMVVLRRQVEEEFPDAVAGDLGATVRGWGDRLVKAVPRGKGSDPGGQVEQLERLSSLYERGLLTEDEFNSQKAQLSTTRPAV